VDCLQWNVATLADDVQGVALKIHDYAHSRSGAQSFSAWFVSELGDFQTAITWQEAGIRNAEIVEDPFCLGVALAAAGVVHLGQGQLQAAMTVLERGLSICRAADLPVLFPRLASNLGVAYALAGQLAEGLPLLEQAVEQSNAMHISLFHALWLIHLSEGYRLAGRMDEAAPLAMQALDLTRKRKEQGYEARTLLLLGDIDAHRDPTDAERAATYYHQALALANTLDMRPLQAHCHRSLGNLYQGTGKREPGRAELTQAIEMYDDMEMTFWSRQIRARLAMTSS